MIDGMQRTLKESLEMRHEEDDCNYFNLADHGNNIRITEVL